MCSFWQGQLQFLKQQKLSKVEPPRHFGAGIDKMFSFRTQHFQCPRHEPKIKHFNKIPLIALDKQIGLFITLFLEQFVTKITCFFKFPFKQNLAVRSIQFGFVTREPNFFSGNTLKAFYHGSIVMKAPTIRYKHKSIFLTVKKKIEIALIIIRFCFAKNQCLQRWLMGNLLSEGIL